ncbi:hypothetical protein [Alkalihalophilus marmarensis]|uniref:hypothetical protein n=1 Tax=Alkalihalophilus marmarensis TaxID=521377 RepID=UPI002E1B8BCF|nr:hypothetical protein [Alkalihalophilus marmarensis]
MRSEAVETKKLLYIFGVIVFGGMLLNSIIDAGIYLEYYSVEKLWEYRLFIAGGAVVYYGAVFLFYRFKMTTDHGG